LQKIVYIGNKLSSHGYTPTTIDELVPRIESLHIEVVVASDKLNKVWRLIDMLSTIVKNRKADGVLIDTYSTDAFYFAYASSQLCRVLGIRYIPILHGGNLPHRFAKSPRLTKAVFGNSFTNIAVSSYLETLLKEHNYPHCLIENSIDINKYQFKGRNIAAARFIWVRSFDEIYNPEMAIRVFKNIHQQYPDARLTMVGPDKDGSLSHCIALAENLGLGNVVNFTGKLSKEAWLALAAEHDIFINTSSYDNLPVSVIEAMALGLIVVSTNAGGLPYLLQHGTNALLSGIKDEAAMTDNLLALLSANATTGSLNKAARNTAEKFDWQQVKHKWLKLFDSLKHEQQ
jgi:L-malate glycosyltransferase